MNKREQYIYAKMAQDLLRPNSWTKSRKSLISFPPCCSQSPALRFLFLQKFTQPLTVPRVVKPQSTYIDRDDTDRVSVSAGAYTPHPHQHGLIFPSWGNVRHKGMLLTQGEERLREKNGRESAACVWWRFQQFEHRRHQYVGFVK